MVLKTRSSSSVVNELAAKLRRDIALGTLLPGARLNIEALKREHKVSHPSIREALALLAGEGYVSSEGNKGYRVLDSSFEDLSDATRLRAELECLGLQWSAANSTPEWRANVVAAHHMLSEVEEDMIDDPKGFVIEWDERNFQFHKTLISNCNSPRLMDTVANLYDLTRRYRLMAYSIAHKNHRDWLLKSAEEHVQLKNLAIDGDMEAACRLLREHTTKNVDQEGATLFNVPMGQ